jgi:hypothetical protein
VERLVDLSIVAIIGSSAGAVGMTVRRIVISLERRGDRKLICHIFDQSKSADVLNSYIELWRPSRAAVTVRSHPPRCEPGSPSTSQIFEEQENRKG